MTDKTEIPPPAPLLFVKQGKPAPKREVPRGIVRLYYHLEHIKEVHLYLDEQGDIARKEAAGEAWSAEYVSSLNNRFRGRVKRNWFPVGTWELIPQHSTKYENGRWTLILSHKVPTSLGYIDFKRLSPAEPDQALIDTLHEREKTTSLLELDFQGEEGWTVQRLIEGTHGGPLTLEVSYAKSGRGSTGNLDAQEDLTDEHLHVLADEAVARLFLQFLEHFGDMEVDYQLAKGGLSMEELDRLMEAQPDRANEIERFANLFAQGYSEFEAASGDAQPPVGLAEFRAMEEAIFYQRKAGNDLALRNQLAIAIGDYYFTTAEGRGSFKRDIGVRRRDSESGVLLYDRHGLPTRSILGYWDSDYRSVNLSKVVRDASIPRWSRELTDENIRMLAQVMGLPPVEVSALVASLFRHFGFITEQFHRRYNGEIGERIIKMMPWVGGFFVGHAMAGFLMTTGWGLAPGLLLLGGLKATGWVLGFDFAFMLTEEATAAGREFVQMEQLHRESGDKEPKLTELSLAHLEAGSAMLIEAMADVVSMGVVVVGARTASLAGAAVRKGLAKPASSAELKFTVDNTGTATKVEPVKPEDPAGTGWLVELQGRAKAKQEANEHVSEGKKLAEAVRVSPNPEEAAEAKELLDDAERIVPRGDELVSSEAIDAARRAAEEFEARARELWNSRFIEEHGPYVGKGMKGKVPKGPKVRLPNGEWVSPTGYGPVYTGTDVPPEVALTKGLPERGSNWDLQNHVEGGKDSALRGGTLIASDPVTGQGAASWAGEGNWVYHIDGLPSWDTNSLLEGRVRTPGGYRGNVMCGEGEHSIPARVPPQFIKEYGRVELNSRGKPWVRTWIENPHHKAKWQ
jgi:hypothetical protein